MISLGAVLVDFLFRLTFGVAIAMGLTSSRWVTSGFFRVHLWVLMGLQTFAALVLYSLRAEYAGRAPALIGVAIAAAVISYVGAVIWMYESARAGKIALGLVAALAAAGCLLGEAKGTDALTLAAILRGGDWFTSGLALGSIITAMLLGHWYLNSPGMRMAPLERLLLLIALALALRAVWSGGGAILEVLHASGSGRQLRTQFYLFLALRWLAGMVGPAFMTELTRRTLLIPNTQSATGILYAATILVFIGELCSRLLSVATTYPV